MRLKVENFAQIRKAEIDLGDLTVLVGPQASGKSIILQLLKLAIDKQAVSIRMWQGGINWKTEEEFLDRYLGEGMRAGWGKRTIIETDEGLLALERLRRTGRAVEKVFFIPAHRALLIEEGRPIKFERFGTDTPVVARIFSDVLADYLSRREAEIRVLFPIRQRLKKDLREKIAEAIFPGGGKVALDERLPQRRLILLPREESEGIPFMSWSVGQREFMPLLLGLYHVTPAGKVQRHDPIETVIIEEPEMGLHPQAIEAFMFCVMDLLARGYRVVISTHSPVVLDVVWGIKILARQSADPKRLLKTFGASTRHDMVEMAKKALRKEYRVFAMVRDGKGVKSRDISDLDPDSRDEVMASWGGLTEFSGCISKMVAEVVSTAEARGKG